jgi:hypothetical protein
MVLLLLAFGPTVSCVSTDRSSEGEGADPYRALERLASQLAETARIAEEAEPSSVPYGRAEGALHVLRLMRRAIDEELAWADTLHPYFQIQDERYARLALGNPDNLYLVARIEDDAVYRITGRLGSVADFTIQLYQGYPGVGRPFEAMGSLGLDSLVTDRDGRFEVVVGGPARDTNWIPLAPDSRRILVRYTYGDWSREQAGEIRIERMGTRGVPSAPPSDAEVARRIEAAAVYLADAMQGYLEVSAVTYAGLELNTLRPLRRNSGSAGGLTNQYISTGRYRLEEGQALIVTTRPSDARYQGFQLGTEWFEALDFTNQVTSLNSRQARLGSDGVYHFIISTRDPGYANWLDASGAPQGQMLLRWQGVSELGPEHEPTIELVPFDEIPGRLPANEPRFGPEERRKQIAQRQAAIERRYGLGAR